MDDDILFYVDVPGSVIKTLILSSPIKQRENLGKIAQNILLTSPIFVNMINQ